MTRELGRQATIKRSQLHIDVYLSITLQNIGISFFQIPLYILLMMRDCFVINDFVKPVFFFNQLGESETSEKKNYIFSQLLEQLNT